MATNHYASSLMLEITVQSAENLRIKGKSIKRNAFAIIRTNAFNSKFTKKDKVRGSNPVWDESFVIHLPMPVMTSNIDLQVRCVNSKGRDRLIGSVVLPVSDFVGNYWLENHLHLLRYMLRDKKERRSGVVNLSVKVKLPVVEVENRVAVGIPV